MRVVYNEQMGELGDLLGEMAGLAGTAMERSTRALLEADLALAEQVIDEHEKITELGAICEEKAFQLLALQVRSPATCVPSSAASRSWPTSTAWVRSHCTSRRRPADAIPSTCSPMR